MSQIVKPSRGRTESPYWIVVALTSAALGDANFETRFSYFAKLVIVGLSSGRDAHVKLM
jgi:hypothetical protein